MDSRAIEMRLRLPAPEEPAILPPLVLPAFDTALGRVAPSVRFRQGQAGTRDPRFAFAIALLALAMAAVIIAGALRLLNDRMSPVNQLQWPPAQGVLGIQDGFTMEWPESWHRLAEGGLEQGDFTQAGISYERVAIILASVELPGCPTSSGSAGPNAVPSGAPFPARTPDPTVVCLRGAPLPPGAIRVTVEVGERTGALLAPDGPAVADTSEPTPESGWTEEIDGQPARLTVVSRSEEVGPGVEETRIWDVIFPTTIDHLIRIRADIGAGEVAAGRAAVQAVVDSVNFASEAPTIDATSAAATLVRTVDELDRTTRENYRSDFYACFPREPGSVSGTISAGPWQLLRGRVGVTCTTALSESRTGLWRIALTTRWPAGAGYPAGGLVHELFVGGDHPFQTAGNISAIDAEGAVTPEGAVAMPEAPRHEPDPGGAPPTAAAGSLIELLAGVNLAEAPGGEPWLSGEYGWRAAVVGGPRSVAGSDWYAVQWDDLWRTWTVWLPALHQGRPVFGPVPPRCPSGDADLEELRWLIAGERLTCYGGRELALGPVVAVAFEPSMCAGDGLVPTACPPPPSGSWLPVEPAFMLFGAEGPDGPVPALAVWVDPAIGPLPSGTQLRVQGHFDDPRAWDCAAGQDLVGRLGDLAGAAAQLECRVRFVITGFEPEVAP